MEPLASSTFLKEKQSNQDKNPNDSLPINVAERLAHENFPGMCGSLSDLEKRSYTKPSSDDEKNARTIFGNTFG